MLHPELITAMAAARRAEDLGVAQRRHAHPASARAHPFARGVAGVGRALVRVGEALLRRASKHRPAQGYAPTARMPQGT